MNHEIEIYLLLVGLRRSNTSAAYRTEARADSCSFLGRLASAAMASTGSGAEPMRNGESLAMTNGQPLLPLEVVISADVGLGFVSRVRES